MTTFILIHGAWHGGWCWDKVKPILEKSGYMVIAPDLPGHGDDKTPILEIDMDAYTNCVCQIIDQQPDKVILVGHSLGGLSITQAAEKRSDKIELLVYLTALLLKNGESRISVRHKEPSGSTLSPNIEMMPRQGYSTVKDESLIPSFYHDCSDEDIRWAKSRLVPQALKPMSAPMVTTDRNFGKVRKVYIECLQDRALVPEFQKQMYSAIPCEKIISMNTSHSPFLSMPTELAKNLMALV
jgi:pimeloyl-ACP methyl ester carboxylesterase